MSVIDLAFYRRAIRRMGVWAGTRYMRNRGVPFEHAYLVLFGRRPRPVQVTL